MVTLRGISGEGSPPVLILGLTYVDLNRLMRESGLTFAVECGEKLDLPEIAVLVVGGPDEQRIIQKVQGAIDTSQGGEWQGIHPAATVEDSGTVMVNSFGAKSASVSLPGDWPTGAKVKLLATLEPSG